MRGLAWIGRGGALARRRPRAPAWLADNLRTGAVDPCLWPPFFMALGVLAYFAGPVALGWAGSLCLIAAALWTRWAARRWLVQPRVAWLIAFAAWSAFGYGVSALRVERAAVPVLPVYDRSYEVTGWVSRVDPGRRPGVVVEVTRLGDLPPEETPERIRVRGPAPAPALGGGVTGWVSVAAPPGPATPGGYDFSRRAWFDGIGGSGFSFGALDAAEVETAGLADMSRKLARLRGAMAARIRSAAPGESGTIAAALLTGDRSAIPDDAAEALRVSGLGHLLAISGLHMALVGGGAFFVFSLALAAIEPWSRNYDMRKPAAAAAIIVSAAYLALSGAPVSAQRAFIMLSVAFIALLCDRRALSLRNVAVAAVLVLTLAPEALMQAGFQMSFAATAALVAAYEAARNRGSGRRRSAPARFFFSLSYTSLIAGAATGVFAAFHFNRWAAYGFIANLAAMPVFTLWVMPFAVIGAALTPLGLDIYAYRIAAEGMDVILWIARTAENAPRALTHTPSGPDVALAVYAAGFVLLCGGRGWVRALSLVVMAAGALAWTAAPRPFLWISDSGVVAVREQGRLYVSDMRRDRYGVEQFAQRLGIDPAIEPLPLRERLACDEEACIGRIAGLSISLAATRRAVAEDCLRHDLVIFEEAASARRAYICGAELFDLARFRREGAALFFHDGQEGWRILTSEETRWHPPLKPSDSAAEG